MSTLPASPVPLFRVRVADRGQIKDLKQLVARIDGLPNCLNGQLIEFGEGVRGIIMGFTEGEAQALVLGDESRLRLGTPVTGSSEPFRIPVGHGFIGRMVTALGEPCDELGAIAAEEQRPVLRDSPSFMDRAPVAGMLATGVKAVDLAVPVAKGQRQLVLGDRVTGKSTLVLDAILNQRGRDVVCIFCAIGKSRSAIHKTLSVLKAGRAFDYTAVLVAPDSAPPGEQYLVPFAAATLGEFFVERGRDVLVVFDDLTKHAWAYRQLSLLLARPPGREAYPGDIFYVQTQLMERAGRFAAARGGGSMTFLGVVETQQGDLTGYIPSNLAAMSDGQIVLDGTAFAEGQRPAVKLGLSLSILGRRVQPDLLRAMSGELRARLSQYDDLARLGMLQAGLSDAAARVLRTGAAIRLLLNQPEAHPVGAAEQMLILAVSRASRLADLTDAAVVSVRDGILEYARREAPALLAGLESGRPLTAADAAELDRLAAACVRSAEAAVEPA